ncbi:MAG: acetyltransferase [Satyrvirus sp.]|uniref:Acetyltransferase n=1 Tax=Satyrvirus sp. TaxID=2487771 RepID=A0A3G5AF23_9VIRU|nr:MAG: acetyltransferase [Satyrvirus sp.]
MDVYIIDVYIIGAGGNSKVVTDICELNKYKIVGIFDDKYTGTEEEIYKKYKLIGKIGDICKYKSINIINSIGDTKIRYSIYQKLVDLNLNWINCIHPNSHLVSNVSMGIGNIICYGSFINSDTMIGNFNLINTYAVIEHDCIIGNFNHIAPRTTLCGGINIGNLNLLGASTTIIPCKKIGNENIIGAMSVIISNFGDGCTIVGIPGKIKNVRVPASNSLIIN